MTKVLLTSHPPHTHTGHRPVLLCAAGADLNRNFPSAADAPCKDREPELCSPATLAQPKSSTQPETRAMMAWLRDANWPHTFAANMHEGAVCANYPWDVSVCGSAALELGVL